MKYLNWIKKHQLNAYKKVVIISGANSGLGFFSSLHFSFLGAKVIMACRNLEKAEVAKSEILSKNPNADLEIEQLDLSSIQSINDFSSRIKSKYQTFDILVNNAGVYMPKDEKTKDGLNMTIGTNFVGNYFLTECLKDCLNPNGRIVFVTSLTSKFSTINTLDPLGYNSKNKNSDYGRSKLFLSNYCHSLISDPILNLKNIKAVSVDPGITASNILSPNKTSFSKLFSLIGKAFLKIFMHCPEKASLVITTGALSKQLKLNYYFAPRGLLGLSGYPKMKKLPKKIIKSSESNLSVLNISLNSFFDKK